MKRIILAAVLSIASLAFADSTHTTTTAGGDTNITNTNTATGGNASVYGNTLAGGLGGSATANNNSQNHNTNVNAPVANGGNATIAKGAVTNTVTVSPKITTDIDVKNTNTVKTDVKSSNKQSQDQGQIQGQKQTATSAVKASGVPNSISA